MKISNEKEIYKARIRLLIFAVSTIVIAGILGTTRLVFPEFLGIKRSVWVIATCIPFVLFYTYNIIIKVNYIYYSDHGEKIILRYFYNSPLNPSKNSIEIPKSTYKGYVLKKTFFGLKKEISLLQTIKGKIATYPLVSVSALTKVQLQKMIASLEKNKK